MALPSDNGIFIHKGLNCSPNYVPTAQSIPISTSDNTTVKSVTDTTLSNIAEDYDATSTYAVGDCVLYERVLYQCTTAIPTAEAWNSAHWTAVKAVDVGSGGGSSTASQVSYDNTQVTPSGQRLSGTNVQDAIDEVVERTWEGTLAQYNAIAVKDPNTVYYVTDASPTNLALNNLSDVSISSATDGQVLTYNSTSSQWVNADTKADRVPAPSDYDPTSTYVRGDFVTYDGNIYMCNQDISTPEQWAYYHWDIVNANDSYLHSLDPNGAGSFSMNRRPNTTVGYCSVAEGFHNEASGHLGSHAEGYDTSASGDSSHAEGAHSTASGLDAHAEGGGTLASGDYAHAEGYSTVANHANQHVFGEWNIADPSSSASYSRGNYVEIVGNGNKATPSNARTLDWSGNETLSGKLTATAVNTGSGDVTLSSKTASSGGTDLSLVTTGEKYNWNNLANQVKELRLISQTFNLSANSSITIQASSNHIMCLLYSTSDSEYVRSIAYLIGGYVTASRCTVTNLTGLTGVTINSSSTSDMKFVITNTQNFTVPIYIYNLVGEGFTLVT